jgi:hypothetical protein
MVTKKQIMDSLYPGEIFADNLADMKKEYKELCKIWHPDINKSNGADEVFKKINELFNWGQVMLKKGLWEVPGIKKFVGSDNLIRRVRYKVMYPFELGDMYIGNNVVVYVLNPNYKNLYNNGLRGVSGFTFSSDRMKKEMEKYLPKVIDKFETKDGYLCLVLRKTPDQILLKDALSYYKGKIPDKHIAWILSSLYNISCYFEYLGISHNSIQLDTVFISPEFHSSSILGGWWYSVKQGNKLISVPKKIFDIIPPHVKNKKVGNIEIDLESIRLIGRELLGDSSGTRLSGMRGIPSKIIDWVRGVSSSTARKDYCNWILELDKAYGSRKFITMDVDISKLYKKGGK